MAWAFREASGATWFRRSWLTLALSSSKSWPSVSGRSSSPAACSAAGKPVGVHATDGVTARRYRDAGCTLITIADDAGAITRHTAAEFGLARA